MKGRCSRTNQRIHVSGIETQRARELVGRAAVVTRLAEEAAEFDGRCDVVRRIGSRSQQLGERAASVVVREQQPDQFEPDCAPGPGVCAADGA